MQAVRWANLALRFALELCALAALAYWAWQTSESLWLRLLAAVGAAGLAAVVWGIWCAPASRRQLPDPWRLIPEVAVFGVAAIGLAASGQTLLGAYLAGLFALNRLVLALVPARPGGS